VKEYVPWEDPHLLSLQNTAELDDTDLWNWYLDSPSDSLEEIAALACLQVARGKIYDSKELWSELLERRAEES
jgi:hypothetical protein